MWIGPTKSHVAPYRTGKAAYKPVVKGSVEAAEAPGFTPTPASLGTAADPE